MVRPILPNVWAVHHKLLAVVKIEFAFRIYLNMGFFGLSNVEAREIVDYYIVTNTCYKAFLKSITDHHNKEQQGIDADHFIRCTRKGREYAEASKKDTPRPSLGSSSADRAIAAAARRVRNYS